MKTLMRCYLTTATEGGATLAIRYAATNALAKADRDHLKETYNLKQSDVSSVQVEIPTAKAELLDFINDVAAKADVELE